MKLKHNVKLFLMVLITSLFAIMLVACNNNENPDPDPDPDPVTENEFMTNEQLAMYLEVLVTFTGPTSRYSAKLFNNGTVGGGVTGTWGWDGADLTMTLLLDGQETVMDIAKAENGDFSFTYTPITFEGPQDPVTLTLTYENYSDILTISRHIVYKGVEEFDGEPTIVLSLYSEDKWQGMYLLSDHTFFTVFSSTGDPDNAPLATVQHGYWAFDAENEVFYLNENGQILTAEPEAGSGDLKFSNTIYIGGYTIIRELLARKANWRLAILGEAAPLVEFYGTNTQLNLLSDMTCELIDFTSNSIDGEVILTGTWTYDAETSEVTISLTNLSVVTVGSSGELSVDFDNGSIQETLTTSIDWEELLAEDEVIEKEVWFEFTGEEIFHLFVYEDGTCDLMYITETVNHATKVGTWTFDSETTTFSLFLGDSTDDPVDYIEYTVSLTAENELEFTFELADPAIIETLQVAYEVWQPLLDPTE